jgi:hypothetical protein
MSAVLAPNEATIGRMNAENYAAFFGNVGKYSGHIMLSALTREPFT